MAVPAAAAVLWLPGLVAQTYVGGPGAADLPWARPDLGWQFLAHAVWDSRRPGLGSHRAAERQAARIWAGPPALAREVELVYLGGPFTVPVPPGGIEPAGRRRAAPRSRLGWRVTGSVRGGPPQMIGLLDYQGGTIVWDIRPLPEGVR